MLEWAGMGWYELDYAGTGWNGIKLAGRGKMDWNGLKWLEFTVTARLADSHVTLAFKDGMGCNVT